MKNLKNQLRPLSIRTLVILFCIPFLAIILFSSLYFQRAGKEQITNLIQSNAVSIVEQVSDTMEEKIQDVQLLPMSVTGSFRYYKMRQNLLSDEDVISPKEYKEFSDSVYDFLEMNSNYFDSVFFCLDDSTVTMYRSNSTKRLLRTSFSFEDYGQRYVPYVLNWITSDSGEYPYELFQASFSRNALIEILGTQDSKVHGVFLFGINDELFTTSLANCKITPSSCVTLVKDGSIQYTSSDIFHTDTLENLSSEDLHLIREQADAAGPQTTIAYESEGNHFIYRPLAEHGMGILAVIPIDEMYLDYNHYSRLVLRFSVLLVLACILLYFIITHMMNTPIQSLVRQMDFISKNHLETRIEAKGGKEIHIIADSVNRLMGQVNILMKNLELEMLAKQNAELQTLYFQINPHFLYNTLDSIRQLCDLGQTEQAGRMVNQLASFYRIGVSKGMSEIPLSDEVTHAEMYLEILRTRFGDFQYTLDIPKELLEYPVIKLVLQPIIENAIYHGLRPYRTDGTLSIHACREADTLLIRVSDDGGGMEERKLEEIRQALRQPLEQNHALVYGIKNVHDRIRLTYGSQYGLELDSELDEGTTVTLKLPCRTAGR